MFASLWFKFAVALALGLLIGLERERSKGEGPSRRPAGIRTFALATLAGALAIHLGGALLLLAATSAVAALAALSYARGHDGDPGLTTAIGLVVAPLIGALAVSDPLMASGIAAAVAVLFAMKTPLHQFVKGVLTESETTDGLLFAVATLAIWPQLPDRYLGPFGALNLHSLWLLVILMLAISACGHMAVRGLGVRYGLPLAGFASGFISSAATTGSMASKSAQFPTAIDSAVAGAAFSTVATFVEMALLLSAISLPVLHVMWPALTAGGIAATAYALFFAVRSAHSTDLPNADKGRPFSFAAALGLAATMAAMMVASAFLRNRLGDTGLVIAAAFSGFIDTHSAALSVASLAASNKMLPQEALWPILAAMTTNAFTKMLVALGMGFGRFALRLVPGILFSMAAAWAVAVINA